MNTAAVAGPVVGPTAWSVESADPDEAGASIRGWRVHFTQLAAGPCAGSVREAVLPSLRLLGASFSSAVAVHSRPLGETDPIQIGVISPVRERLLWDGHRVSADRLMVKEGSQGSNFALPAGLELVVARLDRHRLEALSMAFGGHQDPGSDRLVQLYRVPGPWLDTLRFQLGALLRGAHAEESALTEEIETDFYEQLALALASPRESIRPSPETRRRVVRRTEEYMWAHGQERISLEDLCSAAGCSARTLRYAFRERYGVSPMSLLKRVRLQGLRRDLLDAPSHSTTVLDVALRWGFWHLGHLGRDYKALFRETPAATLTGAPCDASECIRSEAS
jgi:AraC family ethanolamine operon transcriptional activator